MRWFWALALVLSGTTAQAAGYGAPPADLNARLDKLVKSYPDFLDRHDDKYLYLKDGRKFAISDGRTDKTFDEMIEHADIDDMFFADYPAGADATAPAPNFDPGRVRFEPLFDAMYGDCDRGEVEPKMRSIAWLPKHHGGGVSITTVNGVDKALAAVSADLDNLPEKYMRYLIPNSGTYNCRRVAGSTSRSVHAWGAAIDINSAASDYWRWSKDGWHNRIPVEIARVFERHGFIWGGRWWHYDTMHFEYRPELLP
ncbi:MAG: M15 family metallopeptidase [Alphaproteobacteria bacterium]|nr:M15 family metallopeptidase [Alphaproteobacteria bacterium]MBL7098796.1 M15 family metallopeptidase [Alphaproteobacteria bacterium]